MTSSPAPADGLLGRLSRALDIAILAAAALTVAILVALVAGVAFEVVMRYFFNQPTTWVVTLSEYSLLWLAFLGGAWVLREEAHVKVEMLVDALPPRAQRQLHVATSLVGMAVCGLFFWVSAGYIVETYRTGEELFRSIQVKKWAVMSVIVPGLLLLTLQFMRRAWRGLQGPAAAADPASSP